jgi:glycosyltransferase involved in cell wall biosynthesis
MSSSTGVSSMWESQVPPCSGRPLLTIGVPVHNGGRTLRRTLEALLAQTFGDFELYIADNASSDETSRICEEFAARDARIRVIHHRELLSPMKNFESLLDRAQTPFFMFAAADDRCEPTFAEKNIANLQRNPDAVCSVSRVAFWNGQDGVTTGRGTLPLLGTPTENLLSFLYRPEDNSRLYGVYRTDVLKKSFFSESISGWDWVVSALTLLYGKHLQIEEVLLYREITPIETFRRMAARLEPNVFCRIFPAYRFSSRLLTGVPKRVAIRIIPTLAYLTLLYTNISPYESVQRVRRMAVAAIRRVFGRGSRGISRVG